MFSAKIAIIGLGYVGFSLSVDFVQKIKILGFGINQSCVSELSKGVDSTLECYSAELIKSPHLICSSLNEYFCRVYQSESTLAIKSIVLLIY